MLNKSNSLIKNNSIIVCQAKSDEFPTSRKVINKIDKIKNSSNDIDSFAEKIKRDDFIYECTNYDFPGETRKVKIIDNKNEFSSVFIKNNEYLGSGSYGSAFKVGGFAIKIAVTNRMKPNIFGLTKEYSKYERSSRILNKVNEDEDFSRSVLLKDGSEVLVTKYINGDSVTDQSAFEFVKSHGLIMHDYYILGNVKKNSQGEYKLIDADHVVLPYLKRCNSEGSEAYYKDFPYDKKRQ